MASSSSALVISTAQKKTHFTLKKEQKENLLDLIEKITERGTKPIEQQLWAINDFLRKKKLVGEQANRLIQYFATTSLFLEFWEHLINLAYSLNLPIDQEILLQLQSFRIQAAIISKEMKTVKKVLEDINDAIYPNPDFSESVKKKAEQRLVEIKASPYASLVDNTAMLSSANGSKFSPLRERNEAILHLRHTCLKELATSGFIH